MSSDWVDRAFELEHELGHPVDWFDRSTQPEQLEHVCQLTPEETAVRDIHRQAAVLALSWGVSPQFILFALAGLAPDEGEWADLVSGTWDRLPASARANLNALSSEEAA